ncbi:ribonuclease H2, subunit B [Lasiosphaeria hispida]|uniref:Ribonuclease H2 subunit B n=1 Tax=Lasiosphaeria hispida TaxID=260671 RepID=A0AAJ0HG48_9PEZI|nr:ribonuclease H2, subunit B [Lasiosphaeria hispida]
MARTRASKGSAAATAKAKADKTAAAASAPRTYSLAPESESPPRLFIIPKTATPAAQIVTLQNPRYARPARYFVCPEAGFFECTKITTPTSAPRSWLLENATDENGAKKEGLDSQMAQDAELYAVTPIDPIFLLLPGLASIKGARSGAETKAPKKRMFMSSDDHFDALSEPNNHLSEVLRLPGLREKLEARMAAVCDTVDAADEQMFRLNESKLLDEILSKAKRMSNQGLPKSMEEKFVKKALEAPIMGIRSQPLANAGTKPDSTLSSSSTPQPDSADSQSTVSSVETSATSLSEASTAATSISSESTPGTNGSEAVTNAMTASEEIIKLQRLRIAFNFICSCYIAPSLAETLKSMLTADATKSRVDFKPLDEYLAQLAKLRQDAAAARSTDYSRKRAADDEEDERAEKRRKKEEEEKAKKAKQSRGVKELMKVNTTGMKKMSDFFKKK